MELIQKFKKWKESNDDEYQMHVKISSAASDNIDEKLVYMEDLEKRKEVYGICEECNEPGTGKGWCKPCNAKRFEKNFKNWTSRKEDIDELIQDSQLNAVHSTKCLEWIPYEKFQNITHIIDGGFSRIYSATWQEGYICYWDIEKHDWNRIPEQVALKVLDISSENTNFLNEVKSHLQIYVSNIVQCYGITQDPNTENYAIVLKYCRDGNMRDYINQHESNISCELKIDYLLHISRGLLYIHNYEKIHRDLHSGNILFDDGIPYISDLGLCQPVNYEGQEIVYGVLPYIAPEVLRGHKYTKAADIYSFGIVINEFISEEIPYDNDTDDQFYLTVNICKGFRPKISEYTPKLLADLITKCWDGEPDKRPTIQEVVITLKAMKLKNLSSKQQIIQQFKLNYGLLLDGHSIKPSEQAVLSEDGDLDISLYEGQPLVYTFVNDHNSRINLLKFNSVNHFIEGSQSSDISINFPVAEITYSADLLANFMEDESYGHLFAKKILVGGKLFIDDLKSATSTQTDSFKFFLTWVYDSAKYSKENPFNNLTGLNFLPKIRTLDGKDLNTYEKLTSWMNNLYQNDVVDIISYNNLIPISKLRSIAPSSIDEIDEIQPGVANFKEKLSFYDWVGDSLYTNLTRWINERHLIYGLIIDKHFELEISKEVANNFINIPNVYSSDKFYWKVFNPTTSLEEFLISNNIFSTKNVKNIRSFPFTNKVSDEIKSCEDYVHFIVKFEKYKVRFNNIMPSKRFQQAIENALENMKPFTHLQNVFDEYGHFFPLNIVLGKSLKTILPNNFGEIKLESTLFEALDSLNISYLLTTNGSVIEKSDLSNWTQNTDDSLEIIEFDNVISLYDILEEEQKRKINVILNKEDNLRIIMTGIEELKDLDANNTEYYKRINVKPSLEDENYEVFGSVISKHNLKLEDILITFELYDFNGFSAMIKNLNRDVDITECYILWVIIGNPSKLSVFSPRNREFQADYIKKSITLQLDDFYCPIKTSYKLSEGCTISVNTYCSTANYEPNNIKIKLVGWSEDCIYFKIAKSNYNNSNLNNSSNSSESHSQLDDDTDVLINFEVTICILSFHHEKLDIDNREGEKYSLSLIGHDLTENTKVIPFTSVDELGPDQIKYLQKMEASIKRFDDDVGSLKLSDYEMNRNEIPRKNGRVSKWVSVKNRDQKFAFKSISNKKYKGTIQNQVAILKKLHNCNNIIKFYGLVSDGDKWYLVTEWAEYGNLREFYTNHKERFNLRLKLRMSLEIARGLDFLKNVEVLHHDIRAENILITLDETAKLTSCSLNTVTFKQDHNLEQARYYAPELLERNSNTKYDIKCEIYSFGILLWEIAEEKTPYKNYKDIMEIVKFVGAKNREPFSRNSQMPEQFKNLVINAVDHNPEFRPKITKMLEVLNNCFEKSKSTYSHKSQSILIDRASFLIDAASSTGAAIAEAVAAGAPIAIPFSKFVPLFYEIGNIFNEIIELAQAAEHNKRTCDALLQRVYAAELAVQDLKRQRNSKEFFNNKNYLCLQNLVNIIVQIRKFISDISQMKSLIKYFQVKSIEKTFKELCKEFDSCVNILSFEINVDTSDEIRQLKADQEDLLKYIQGMGDGNIKKIDDTSYVKDDAKEIKACLANLSKEFSSTVAKVNAMNNTMEKFMNETSQNQRKIDNIFQTHPLKFADYERDNNEKPRKNGHVTKWYKIKSMDEEFAFKTISEKEDQKIVQNQVTILKELYDWQNIIKFYGITYDGNKWYLVTEWAEYGNLREFYQNKHDFELKLKLRISLDIARGLNFLRTVEIIHRDIRAENILITLNETAKLANFKLSRYLTGSSINQSQNLERVRYCAPELLERAPNYKYDQKCEVYSFGILLWEIAEKRIPYQGNDDILDITDKVRNKMYREPFSAISQMPDKFKELQIDAVQHDPDFRPKITKMFEVLRNCVKDYSERHSLLQDSPSSSSSELNRKPSTPKPISKRAYSIDQEAYTLPIDLPDFESFKYMTLADAAKQHRLYDKHGKLVGNVKIAYKCFEAYANLSNTGGTANRNQIKAKYYKAYYISKGLVESPPNKDKIVAELFKEVADDEVNEFPEAKVRYGDYLYHGKGVDQNFTEALKYFEKAAEDGFKVAMYNAGNIYYNGISGIKDREKAIHYMKLAAYNDYEPAIKFCKEHNL